ncbi:NADH:flavin oxidoreductase [Chloroflexota bacterium]
MEADAFDSLTIKGLEIPNRFMRSATHDFSADLSGATTDKSIAIYEMLGQADIGLIVSGYAFVSSHGRAFAGQYGAHCDEMIPGLKRMAEAVHKSGGRVALQIVHAGMQSPYMKGRHVPSLAPSELKNDFIETGEYPHREMSVEEIEGIVRDFGSTAVRAREAGFDAVQLHGAHGYLMSQFFSPVTNRRTDIWGGTPENRRRFHVEVTKEVRRRLGSDFPVLIKFGVMDDEPGGATIAEGIDAAKAMIEAGMDAIEVSSGVAGGILQKRTGKDQKPYYRERAAALKYDVSVPVMVVGGIRDFDTAQDILGAGDADMLSMCRPFIREPGLIKRWLSGNRNPAKCISCNQCIRLLNSLEILDNYCWQEYRAEAATSRER